MQVRIGPYLNWLGPYQIAEKILFWKDRYEDESVHKFGAWLANDAKGNDSYLTKFCEWIHSKKKRKVQIKLHKYDTWNLYRTLALIILPLLKQLKETKHGSGFIDNSDVPEELQDPENTWCAKKYDWFLDELIWAFDLICSEDFEWEYDNAKRLKVENALKLFGKYYLTLWD